MSSVFTLPKRQIMKTTVFSDVTPFILVDKNQRKFLTMLNWEFVKENVASFFLSLFQLLFFFLLSVLFFLFSSFLPLVFFLSPSSHYFL